MLALCAICGSLFTQGQTLIPQLDKSTGKYGYKEAGQPDWSLEPKYKSAYPFWNRLAVVNDGSHSYFIDLQGNKVSPDFISISTDFVFRKDGAVPYICEDSKGYNLYDHKFNPICETYYKYMSYDGDCLVRFGTGGQYGIMDMGGNVLIPPVYKQLEFEDLYYVVGWKKCDKDGIKQSDIDDKFLTARNVEGKYGIITRYNEVIVPFKYKGSYDVKYKGAKRSYTKTIKPYILNQKNKERDSCVVNAWLRACIRNEELSKTYTTALPSVEKTTVSKTKSGYIFTKAGKQVGRTYKDIEEFEGFCIVTYNGKYGVTDPLGTEMIKCEYDNICVWNEGADVLMAEKEGKYALVTSDGTELPAKGCDMIFLPSNNVGVALKDDQYWLIDSKGNIISGRGYEIIDNYSSDGKIYAELLGYKTELSADGKEVSSIAKQIFDEAYKMSDEEESQEKYDKYVLCASIDIDNKEGYRALSLNNIGSLFENLGDIDTAMEYYTEARGLGSETARKNIKRIKFDRALETIAQVGNALAQVAEAMDASNRKTITQQEYANYQPASTGGSFSSTDSSSKNGAHLENSYRMWENNARSIYNSLTNLGTRTKKNGKDSKGSTDQSMTASTYTSMKRSLREAQREMARIRRTAASQGITIVKSEYEDIQVSY